MGRRRPAITFTMAGAIALLSGCGGEQFSEADKADIASLSLSSLPPLPADLTNRHADDPAAADLGSTLFFDQRMSPGGGVSCATCHLSDRQFQDDLPLAEGVSLGNRRTMPLAGVVWGPWFFWDGRRDSLWSQALVPLEDPREHGGTRTFYAHFVAGHYADAYVEIFGPLPDLSSLPGHAGPFGSEREKAAWAAMTPQQQEDVNRVFSNIGKAMAAFERTIAPEETRFDRFAGALSDGRKPEGDETLTPEEIAGLRLFIGKADCASCHAGPRLTDDSFHNTGVPLVAGLPEDIGREAAVKEVEADPFNCFGSHSDAGPEACGELRFMVRDDPRLTRAYKPPSLRGAATRPPYMHSGQFGTLEEVVDHYNLAPAAPSGETELHPLGLSVRERQQLVAFLKTLAD